jgi:hypothetical protein
MTGDAIVRGIWALILFCILFKFAIIVAGVWALITTVKLMSR